MEFVGRHREISTIIQSLRLCHNVVLTGRFGVGRSRLVKHAAKIHSNEWQFLFADFSKTASQSFNNVVNQIAPHLNKSKRNHYVRLRHAKDIVSGEKDVYHLPRVIVLDNIGRISKQKLAFIRNFRFDSKLLFIAIGESFLSENELFRLRAVLYPSDVLALHNLNKNETIEFYRHASQRKQLSWSNEFIQTLAASTEGYPLLMNERLYREIGMPKSKKGPKSRGML